jgi:hypothetical protein
MHVALSETLTILRQVQNRNNNLIHKSEDEDDDESKDEGDYFQKMT